MKIKKPAYITILVLIITSSHIACKKKKAPAPPTPPVVVVPPPVGDTTTVNPVADPTTANTIGFFLADWQGKNFVAPAYNEASPPATTTGTVTIDASSIITKIPRSIYGHNAVVWMPPMNNEPTLITNVTNLHPHVIRFPAGSGSDVYFWNKAPNQLPPDVPATLTAANGTKKDPGYWYGITNDNWRSSLDQYYSMLQKTNNQGMITVNYGYARYGTSTNPVATAAHYAADWVRYDNGRTQYWEVGNENFGDWEWGYRIDKALNKDGQPEIITGALYGAHFKVFVDSMKAAAASIGKTIYIGAVCFDNPASESWQTSTTKTWNQGMMTASNNKADYYVLHNYFTPYNAQSNATEILQAATNVPATMTNFITQTLTNNGATIKPLAMNEWNMFAVGLQQQVSNVSGLFAVIVVNEVIKNKIGMASRWDMFNAWETGNDHGLFSAGDEPSVARWSPRPSFYYLYFFQKLIGDRMVPTIIQNAPNINAYASTYNSGEANITLVNTGTISQTIEIKYKNFKAGNRYYWYTLEGGTDNGEFSRKIAVNGNGTSLVAGGPLDYATLKANSALANNGVKVTVPARGTVCLAIEKK
jgi:hypothetical protein